MPALYVSNPRDSKGRFKKARRANPPKHVARRRRKKNPAAQQKMFAEPKRRRRAARKAKAATSHVTRTSTSPRRKRRSPPRPRVSKRWHFAKNPRNRGRGGRFTSRRGKRGGGRKRNALSLSNPVGGIPVIGTAVAMLGPALFGVVGIELIGQGRKIVAKYIDIPEMLEPYEFTIVGLLLAGFVQLFTFIPAPIRHSLGLAMASAGSAVDWFRYRQASGAYGALDMGDGGEWDVNTLSDAEAYGALDLAGLDLSGDEDLCGPDFSVSEGEAMAEGYGAYLRRYPFKKHPRAARMGDRPGRHTPAHEIHDARREGDRWHWLAMKFTAEDLRKLANMPPEQRLRQIQACKAACKDAVHRRMEAPPPAPTPRQIVEQLREVPIDPNRVRYEAFSQQAF